MKKILLLIFINVCCISVYSQGVENQFIKNIQSIKQEQGDFAARTYLESKKDSLNLIGESSTYLFFWGILTSNMWNTNPTEELKKEYKHYLEEVIVEDIKSNEYIPNQEILPTVWQFSFDYYNMIYTEGDKETTLVILKNIHRWFKQNEEAKRTIGYTRSLLDLCLILVRDMHKYKEGEAYCKEYAETSKIVYGENSAQHAIALYNITILPQISTEEQLHLLEQAMKIYKNAGIPDEAMYKQMTQSYQMKKASITGIAITEDLNESDNLSLEECFNLVVSGRGEVAHKRILEYKEKIWNEEHIDTLKYASVITLLINSYMQQGDLASAQSEIESFDKVIGIDLDKIPADYVQIFYSSAGLIAYHLKDYPKALKYSQAACNLFENTGNYNIEYCKVLANIAMIYAEAGIYLQTNYYLDAKWHIDEAISIFEERIGPLKEHGNIGITLLSNKAIVYNAIGDTDDAILALEDIVENFSNNIDVKNAWILAVNNLASMYMKQNRWADGAHLLEKIESQNYEQQYLFSQNLAICRMYMNDHSKTADAIRKMNKYATKNIDNIFSHFADIERNKYWSQISKELILINNLAAYHINDGITSSIAYDNALFCKNLILNSSRIIDRYVASSSDQQIKQIYYEYKDLKEMLAFKTEVPFIKDSLSSEITRREKIMLQAIGNLGQLLNNETKSWKDVQESLEMDEIAIEFCYAPRMEKYGDIEPYYGAFILRKDFEYPILVSLENVDKVEDIFEDKNADEIFINEIYSPEKSATLHNMLWSKLTPYLKGIKTVYYSPTGYLSNLNFDVLQSENGQMLNEQYSMYRVSSTANINEIKKSSVHMYTSILYGNVKYDETTEEMVSASSTYDTYSGTPIQSSLALRSENERGKWGPIPSTKKEIDNIGRLLSQKGIDTKIFEGGKANEESFKSLDGKSPDILHLATHGFVIDSPERAEGNKFVASTNIYSQKDSYLMWTGLMLAGGNNIWQGNFNLTNIEDGILTADEISRLDLSKTKLVVLSACETAKGKIDPVDGVYGLQRAFKIAGAGSIIMSLWKVQDDATSLLMTQFYVYLTKGLNKHQALWKAMMDVKDKYHDPYYWAAFIILD